MNGVHYDARTKFGIEAIHGIVLFIGWGVLMDASVIFARYLKTNKYYLRIHTGLALTTVLSSVAVEAILIVFWDYFNFRIKILRF